MTMPSDMTLAPINEAAERSSALILETRQRAAAITDTASYQAAADLSANIKRAIKHLEAVGGPLVKKTWDAYKEAKGLLDARLRPYQEAETIIKNGLRTYDDRIAAEQAAIEAENQRRAREHAEKVWQEEQAAAKRKRDEDEALAKAMKAEEAGNKAKADAILETIQPTPPPAPPPPPPPVQVAPLRPAAAGVSYRDNWKAEVVDLMALVKAVASGQASIDYLMPNNAMLNSLAKSKKETMAVPGVKAWNDRVVNQRI